ncbi:MAG: TIGR03905 family TSCPD domain-containing protein [Oscillospiraceae bacterium]
MENYIYKPKGVCTRQISFDTDGKIVENVKFTGGCNGNTSGISRLVQGMDIKRVIELLGDVDCNGKGTSCPAQLAKALKEVI